MADLVEDTATSLTKTVAGTERVFSYLNTYDKAEVLREYRKRRKVQVVENLKTAGATPDQIVVDLNAFDEDPPSNWIRFLNEPEGQLCALAISLRKTYGAEAEAIAREVNFTPDEAVDVMIKLCGLRRVEPLPETPQTYGEGGDGPNPPPPLTYNATTTGTTSTPTA